MSILIECPICHKKHASKNKVCQCGQDLDKAKRSKKVRYWISYRMPGGKQRREFVGSSIEEARDADGKRRGQKREGRIFEMLPDSKLTYNELSEWYLGLESVKNLVSYERIKIVLKHFRGKFGDRVAGTVAQAELEDYQAERLKGIMRTTLDTEIITIKTMINKCFENDKVDARTLKTFRRLKRKAKPGAHIRKRTLALDEYKRLLGTAPTYIKNILVFLMNTGCRPGEARNLKWSYIDRKEGFIRLPAEAVKENKPKSIPINHHVKRVLDSIPRLLHCEYVFSHNGERFRNPKFARWAFESSCIRAGVSFGRKKDDGLTLHDIRRTAKTNMVRAGIADIYRNALLGHAMEGMDKYYVIVSDADLQRAMTQYTEWLDAELQNVDQNVDQPAAANT
jgi:integrase